jgi:hypothetical protein
MARQRKFLLKAFTVSSYAVALQYWLANVVSARQWRQTTGSRRQNRGNDLVWVAGVERPRFCA